MESRGVVSGTDDRRKCHTFRATPSESGVDRTIYRPFSHTGRDDGSCPAVALDGDRHRLAHQCNLAFVFDDPHPFQITTQIPDRKRR